MKILFISDYFPPESNAPASRLHDHAKEWVKLGHDVTIVTCAPNFPEGRIFPGYKNHWRQVEMIDGIRVVRMKSYIAPNSGFGLRVVDNLSFMVTGFFGGLIEKRPDIVVSSSPQFFTVIAAWLLSVFVRRPYVFEVRDIWPASITAVGAMRESAIIRLLEKIELFLYRRAEIVIPVTNAFKKDMTDRGIDSDKIEVVINGVDISRYAPLPRDEVAAAEFGLQEKFVAAYMGTHGMAHSLPKVLEAAELLLDEPRIAFLFAGAGAERGKVEQLVAERGLHNVRLIPRQPKERMPALWSLCDVSLVPLRDTPVFATVIPSKIFESMAMGVPILMSVPEGEATGMIRETGSGLCIPPENPQAMADTLRMLLDDPAQWQAMHNAGIAAAPRFSRTELASKMILIFEKVLKRNSR